MNQNNNNQHSVFDFESDNGLMKVLNNGFGSVLAFIFYADWNEPSKEFLENIKKSIPVFGQYDNVKYYSFCAEKSPETFQKYTVEKTPSIVLTDSHKKILHRYEEEDIGSFFDVLAKLSEDYKEEFQKDTLIWHAKAKNLIQSCPVIIFGKGTPTKPFCGFTKTLFEIMKQHNIEFAFYDLHEDNSMRHWMRHYIKHPTFPIIFSNGKLIGGLDFCKELIKNGEFLSKFPESSITASGEERYNKLLNENETIVFSDGFPFENKLTETLVQKVAEKYGEKSRIFNIAVDKSLKAHITEALKIELPYTVHQKKIVQV